VYIRTYKKSTTDYKILHYCRIINENHVLYPNSRKEGIKLLSTSSADTDNIFKKCKPILNKNCHEALFTKMPLSQASQHIAKFCTEPNTNINHGEFRSSPMEALFSISTVA